MTNLIKSLRGRDELERSSTWPTITVDQWATQFGFGLAGGTSSLQTSLGGSHQEIGADFRGYAEGALRSNGVVFACIAARLLVFSEARFQFRRLRSGRPGEMFGDRRLLPLEHPWQGATTGDLLTRGLLDSDLAGNAYFARRRDGIRRMRPDWVTVIMGSDTRRPDQDARPSDLDVEVLGYAYYPGGPGSGVEPEILLREEVAHFAPIPDPLAVYRGMSWLTPVLPEIMGDAAATTHKLQFFENAATPNLIVTLDPQINSGAADRLQEKIASRHGGIHRAYETMVLGGGADAKVVGADMRQIAFKETQGHGETRIAAAAGVPPVIVGLSEGLQAATYSNYAQAKRRFADGTLRPLWRNMAGSLASIIDVPSDAELWYDDRDIPFLQEDQKDFAEIQQTQSVSIKQLVEAGYEPESVIEAVTSGDFKRLKHTGLFSVQLQEAGSGDASKPAPPPAAD